MVRKKYQVKKKKSILKNCLFRLTAFWLVLAGGLVYLIVFSTIFEIKEIWITGNEKILSSNFQSFIWPRLEKKVLGLGVKNLLFTDNRFLENQLMKEFPLASKIRISQHWPDILAAEIEERQAVANWCQNQVCFWLDKTGVVFFPGQKETLPIIKDKGTLVKKEISLGQKVLKEKTLSPILEIQKTVSEKMKIGVAEFTLSDEGRLDAKTNEDWRIFFDLNQDLNWQLVRLELLLEKELTPEKRQGLEYIDLRFSKIYYK